MTLVNKQCPKVYPRAGNVLVDVPCFQSLIQHIPYWRHTLNGLIGKTDYSIRTIY